MKEFIKSNFAIIFAFLLPVVLIIVVALYAYIPSMSFTTNYDFIYASCENNSPYYYDCNSLLERNYKVTDGKLVFMPIEANEDLNQNGIPDIKETPTPRLFFHTVTTNEDREVTLAEAQTFNLSSLLTSPEGVTVSDRYDSGPDFFPFFGGNSSYGHFLTKGNKWSKLHLVNDTDGYYQNNFYFIGWVLPK